MNDIYFYQYKRKQNANVIWIISTLMLMVVAFSLFASITIYIDPLFHYHEPLEKYEYPINNERYQNDGIIRNFKYDSIITGTSMTENFKVSEAAEIFNADFIKVPFAGAYYKEINDNLRKAYDTGHKIKYVIRCLDYNYLIYDKDTYKEDVVYPTYLYNNNIFDDVNYVLNKSILFKQTWDVIEYTRAGNKTTSMDDYMNWNALYPFGAEAVLSQYTLEETSNTLRILTEKESIMVLENIQQNVTDLADEHPETIFYLFFPPYSICYWDTMKNAGLIEWHINAEKVAIEEILKHPNIKLYSFCNYFELICNLDNYINRGHYGEWVNSWILEWMYKDEYLLTSDNYEEYLKTKREFYNSYDYNSLRE